MAILGFVDRKTLRAESGGERALAGGLHFVGVQAPRPRRDGCDGGFLVGDVEARRRCGLAVAPVREEADCGHHRGIDAGTVESQPGRRVARRLMRPAAGRHAAARGEADDGRRAEVQGVRDGDGDLRLRLGQAVVEGRGVGIEDDVRLGAEIQEQAPVRIARRIQHDALLAPVAGEKRRAAAGGVAGVRNTRQALPCRCAFGRLDQPHLGAETAPDRAGVFGEGMRDLHHPYAVQQASHLPSPPTSSAWSMSRRMPGSSTSMRCGPLAATT